MLLNNKTAIVYGAAGRIGAAVSLAFAKEGATVVLAGRRRGGLEFVAEKIRDAGGRAEVAVVDALMENEVNEHALQVVNQFGSVDISFNAIGVYCKRGLALKQLSLYEFEEPALTLLRSNFITAMSAATHMTRKKSGTILILTASDERCLQVDGGGFLAAYHALEAFGRQLAGDITQDGCQVNCIRYTGSSADEWITNDMKTSPLDKLRSGAEDCNQIASIATSVAANSFHPRSLIVETSS